MTPPQFEILRKLLSTFLNLEYGDPQALADWVKRAPTPEAAGDIDTFKQGLRAALETPGTITPEAYEKWTHESFDTQKEVQARLQETWDACFG